MEFYVSVRWIKGEEMGEIDGKEKVLGKMIQNVRVMFLKMRVKRGGWIKNICKVWEPTLGNFGFLENFWKKPDEPSRVNEQLQVIDPSQHTRTPLPTNNAFSLIVYIFNTI